LSLKEKNGDLSNSGELNYMEGIKEHRDDFLSNSHSQHHQNVKPTYITVLVQIMLAKANPLPIYEIILK